MFRILIILLALLFINMPSMSQKKTDKFLADILHSAGNARLNTVLNDPETFRVQIIYTEINRDKNNNPIFRNYYYNYDPNLYFNPASMVKLPLALLSLEKLNSLSKKGIDKYTTVVFDSSYAGQVPLHTDATSATGKPSIAHFIKRAF